MVLWKAHLVKAYKVFPLHASWEPPHYYPHHSFLLCPKESQEVTESMWPPCLSPEFPWGRPGEGAGPDSDCLPSRMGVASRTCCSIHECWPLMVARN